MGKVSDELTEQEGEAVFQWQQGATVAMHSHGRMLAVMQRLINGDEEASREVKEWAGQKVLRAYEICVDETLFPQPHRTFDRVIGSKDDRPDW